MLSVWWCIRLWHECWKLCCNLEARTSWGVCHDLFQHCSPARMSRPGHQHLALVWGSSNHFMISKANEPAWSPSVTGFWEDTVLHSCLWSVFVFFTKRKTIPIVGPVIVNMRVCLGWHGRFTPDMLKCVWIKNFCQMILLQRSTDHLPIREQGGEQQIVSHQDVQFAKVQHGLIHQFVTLFHVIQISQELKHLKIESYGIYFELSEVRKYSKERSLNLFLLKGWNSTPRRWDYSQIPQPDDSGVWSFQDHLQWPDTPSKPCWVPSLFRLTWNWEILASGDFRSQLWNVKCSRKLWVALQGFSGNFRWVLKPKEHWGLAFIYASPIWLNTQQGSQWYFQ